MSTKSHFLKDKKMNKKILILFFCAFVTIINSCDTADYKLKVSNNADEDLFFTYGFEKSLYRDNYIYLKHLRSNDTVDVGILGGEGTWENRIRRSPKKTVYIFIYFPEMIKTYLEKPHQSYRIQSSYLKIDKHYVVKEFGIEELDNRNWVVAYPSDFE